MRHCAIVCCVSEQTAHEVARFFGLADRQLAVTYQSVNLGPYREQLSDHFVKAARCLCFPSLAEGFGLPVLEAMSLGVPVITANRPALREVAGDAALFTDPRNIAELAAALRHLSSDDLAIASSSR